MMVRSFNTPSYCGSRHDRHRRKAPPSQSMHVAIRIQSATFWCGASNQRVAGAGVGSGGGAAALLGGFGFFGRIILFRAGALGGGATG
jgi:hypothetical protein